MACFKALLNNLKYFKSLVFFKKYKFLNGCAKKANLETYA